MDEPGLVEKVKTYTLEPGMAYAYKLAIYIHPTEGYNKINSCRGINMDNVTRDTHGGARLNWHNLALFVERGMNREPLSVALSVYICLHRNPFHDGEDTGCPKSLNRGLPL